jgi:hypothetical protein
MDIQPIIDTMDMVKVKVQQFQNDLIIAQETQDKLLVTKTLIDADSLFGKLEQSCETTARLMILMLSLEEKIELDNWLHKETPQEQDQPDQN